MTSQNQNPLPLLPDPLEDQPAQLPAATPPIQLETASKPSPVKASHNYWRIGLISVGAVIVLLAILFGPRLTTLLNLRGSRAGQTVTLDSTNFQNTGWSEQPNGAFVVSQDGKLILNPDWNLLLPT